MGSWLWFLRLPRTVEVAVLLLRISAAVVFLLHAWLRPALLSGFLVLFDFLVLTSLYLVAAGSSNFLFITRIAVWEGKIFLAHLLFDKMSVS